MQTTWRVLKKKKGGVQYSRCLWAIKNNCKSRLFLTDVAKWQEQSDNGTSHQVLDNLGEHLYHRDVTDTSQGHGRRWEDEISSQDRLEERKEMTLIFMWGEQKKSWADFTSLTFLSPQISLMVLFPLRLSDPSITSSCTRLAVWIISEIIAMALCPGSKSLQGQTLDYTSYNNLVITGCGATSSYNCIRGHSVLVANKTWDSDGIFWSGVILLYPDLLLWMLSARAIRTTIMGRMAFPLPSK